MRPVAAFFSRAYGLSGRLLFLGAILSFGFLLGADVLVWLKTAAWPHVSAADALAVFGWSHPQSTWVGLQKILDAVPAWQAAPEVCFAVLLLLLVFRSLALGVFNRLQRGASARADGSRPGGSVGGASPQGRAA